VPSEHPNMSALKKVGTWRTSFHYYFQGQHLQFRFFCETLDRNLNKSHHRNVSLKSYLREMAFFVINDGAGHYEVITEI
jgi:hypothetical protein